MISARLPSAIACEYYRGDKSVVAICAAALCLLVALAQPVANGAESRLPALPAGQAVQTSASQDLCERLLSALESTRDRQSPHPVDNMLTVWELALDNSSYLSVWRDLPDYRGLGSLDKVAKTIREIDVRQPSERERRSQAKQYYRMFQQAAGAGQDHTLASLLSEMAKINKSLRSALFFAGYASGREPQPQQFRLIFMREQADTDESLATVQDDWNRLGEAQRRDLLEWAGRIFADGVQNYYTTSVHFHTETGKPETPPTVTESRMLPDIQVSLEDYLKVNQGKDTKADLTKLYYREVALRLFKLYGIQWNEGEPTKALPAPSWFQRIRALVGRS